VDLAENLHDHLVTELSGDTTAARRVIESALLDRQIEATFMDEQGNFCSRVRVSREMIEELMSR